MPTHEYTILGLSRTHLGRYLGVVAGIAGSLGGAIMVLSLGFFKWFGYSEVKTTYITLPVLTPVFYLIFHFAFDKYFWKTPFGRRLFGMPDLSGKWFCNGVKLDGEQVKWRGDVTITQCWEKISIIVRTTNSVSDSISASLVRECDSGCGYKLMYTYKNQPNIQAAKDGMSPHTGYCELNFNSSLDSAEGHYFNNLGRISYGTMMLLKDKGGC